MNLNSTDIINDFVHGNKIYLNNASVSLMPKKSIDAMKDFLIDYNSLGPDSSTAESFVIKKLCNIRKIISQMINSQPDEIVLTQSVTDGINFVSSGLILDPDSQIIIRGSSHEHHSNFYPWLKLGERCKLCNLDVNQNGFFQMEQLRKSINSNTKLLTLSHALYNTGAIMPVKRVGELLKQQQQKILYFIDAAQTVGCTNFVNVKNIGCDFMSFNGSKWLCGPMGTGVFYCNRQSSNLLHPSDVGGESAILYDDNKLAYKQIPDKFQTGFRNYVGIVGLETSIQYLLSYGLQNIRKKVISLANILRDELQHISGVTLYGPTDQDERTSIVSFSFDSYEPQYIVEKFEKNDIILAVREIMDKKIVRVSPHLFNSQDDMLQVVHTLKKQILL